MLVGMVNDPQFGPTVACGAGGTLVELLKDVSVRSESAHPPRCGQHAARTAQFPLAGGLSRRATVRHRCTRGRPVAHQRAGGRSPANRGELDCNPSWSVRLERLSWTRACGLRPRHRDGRSGRAAELLPTPKGWDKDHPAGRGSGSTSKADWSQATRLRKPLMHATAHEPAAWSDKSAVCWGHRPEPTAVRELGLASSR